MTAMATTPVPQPVAIDGAVTNDVATRTLVVRRPETASGYQKLLWREAHQALTRAAESGWRTAHPYVWGGALGNRQIVHGQPGDYLTLTFHFPPGEPAYAKLVVKPGLTAIVTMDRGLRRFMGVQFRHRP
jgi:hypothetical protein